jgi:uncharacterized membrane protein YiaA
MRESAVVAVGMIAAMIMSGALWIWSARSLYADGSYLLLTIIQTGTFFHVSDTRASATFLSQFLPVLGVRAGLKSMPVLIALYTLGMSLVPIFCYSISIWISRRKPILFVGTTIIILNCFYPMSFLLVGEANIYIALFWLSLILLLSGSACNRSGALLVLLLSAAAVKVYEMSVIFSLIAGALSLLRARTAATMVSRICLIFAAILFLVGAWFGLEGSYVPRDALNEKGFVAGVLAFWDNGTYEGLLLLTSLSVASAFAPDRWLRAGMFALVACGFAMFAYSRSQFPSQLALGYAMNQRAQAFIILGGITLILLLVWRAKLEPLIPGGFHASLLLVPTIAIVSLDAYESVQMHDYLKNVCSALEVPSRKSRPDFFLVPEARKLEVDWTIPIVSILLRPPHSGELLLRLGYHGWEPFDPSRPPPQIDEFKRDGSFCKSS